MSRHDKLLTVSIAAYNVEKYIAEALESCVAVGTEFASRLEVIVVNDGSSDATLSVALEFESQYPDVVRVVDKANGGYGSTINCALKQAHGKYFRCLDGDDWFDSPSLEYLLEILDDTNAEAIYTPFSHYYEANGSKELVDCLSNYSEETYELSRITDGSFLALTYLTYRTDCLRKMDLRITEGCFYTDCEFAFLPFQYVKEIYVTHVPLYCYRIGREGQSISIEGLSAHYQDNLKVCSGLVESLAGNPRYQSGCLLDALASLCTTPYSILFTITPKKERKHLLIEFDRQLSAYPELYLAIGKKSKKVRLARDSHFIVYRLFCMASRWGR